MKTLITAAALVLASSTAFAGWDNSSFMGDTNTYDNSSFNGNGTANGAGNGRGSADGEFEFAMSFKGKGKADMQADTKADMAANGNGVNDWRGYGNGSSTDNNPYYGYGYAPVAPQAPAAPVAAK